MSMNGQFLVDGGGCKGALGGGHDDLRGGDRSAGGAAHVAGCIDPGIVAPRAGPMVVQGRHASTTVTTVIAGNNSATAGPAKKAAAGEGDDVRRSGHCQCLPP
jgi:hypothetical protein